MSHEPEKQIEQQLREHAAKRRAEAEQKLGAGLHPANRKVLQGEVARTYGIKGPSMEKTAKPWWAYWPGLIFAGGLAVILMVVVLQFSVKDKLGNMAKMESVAPQEAPAPIVTATPGTPAPVPPSAPMTPLPAAASPASTADNVVAKRKVAEQQQAAPASAPIADAFATSTLQPAAKPMPSAPMAKAERMESAKTEEVAGAKVAADKSILQKKDERKASSSTVIPAEVREALKAKEMATYPKPAGTVSASQAPVPSAPIVVNLKNDGTMSKQMKGNYIFTTNVTNAGTLFVNKLGGENEAVAVGREQAPLRRNFQSPPRPAVLNQFQLKQSGNTITIVDQDGSVYSGEMGVILDAAKSMEKDAADRKSNLAETSRASVSRTRASDAMGQYFRVIGTNVTLQQPIVVYGELVPYSALTNAAAAGLRGGAFNRAAGSLNESNQTVVPAQMQIQGRVQIGENQEMILDAIPMNK